MARKDHQSKSAKQQGLFEEGDDVVVGLAAMEASELTAAIAELLVAALDDEAIGGSRDE